MPRSARPRLAPADLARLRLPVVDLTPVFADRVRQGEHPYLVSDPHWNARGHAIAAAALLEPVLALWGDTVHPQVGTR